MNKLSISFLRVFDLPKVFSTLVGKRIKEGSVVRSTSARHIEIAGCLEDFLKSEMFVKGITRVYAYEHRNDSIPPTLVQGLKTLTEKFDIECLHSFRTSLFVFSTEVLIAETSRGYIFLRRAFNEDPAVLLMTESFLDSVTKSGSTFFEKVSDSVQDLLQTLFKQDSIIVSMLSLRDSTEILKQRGIKIPELPEEDVLGSSRRGVR